MLWIEGLRRVASFPIAFGLDLFLLLAVLNVQVLHEAPVELAEAFLVLFVEEHFLNVAPVLHSLVQLVQKGGLQVASLHLWRATVAVVQTPHRQYRGSVLVTACRWVVYFWGREHFKEIQDARVQKVAFGLIVEEYFQDAVENAFLNHEFD